MNTTQLITSDLDKLLSQAVFIEIISEPIYIYE